MKTVKLELFSYDELSKEAKEKALKDYIGGGIDLQSIQVDIDGYIEQLLEERGIKPIKDLKGYETKYANIFFSLSHCQGDGVMFEGVFSWNGYTVTIRHSGNYCHSYSKTIEIADEEGNTVDTNEPFEVFEAMYQQICKELEAYGYECIEHQESEEYFRESCDSMDCYFEEDGTMNNNYN